MNLYVGNLSKDITEEELQKVFSEYGYISSVKIIKDKFSGESRGFAFIDMPGAAEAKKALTALDSKELKGKKIVVSEANPRRENNRVNGMDGGRGGRNGGNYKGNGNERRKAW
jgi:RNA recognition motif-containing protein